MAAAGMIGSSFMGKSYASTAITDTDQVITPTPAITNPDCRPGSISGLEASSRSSAQLPASRLTAGGRWIKMQARSLAESMVLGVTALLRL